VHALNSSLKRWIQYQQERFPLKAYLPLVLVTTWATLAYTGNQALPSGWLLCSACVLIFYLHLRIYDEFKDYADDLAFRPYRPVPRGLVQLRELAWIGITTALFQLAIVLWQEPRALPWLLGTWAYTAFMGKEFFVGDWLKERPLLYMLSHLLVVGWIAAFTAVWAGGVPFTVVLLALCTGALIEFGRKIRLPAQEESGVETYSFLLGIRPAVGIWLGVLALGALVSGFGHNGLLVLAIGLLFTLLWAEHATKPPYPNLGRIELLTPVWVLVLYIALALGRLL
jgi:hypothetical protein